VTTVGPGDVPLRVVVICTVTAWDVCPTAVPGNDIAVWPAADPTAPRNTRIAGPRQRKRRNETLTSQDIVAPNLNYQIFIAMEKTSRLPWRKTETGDRERAGTFTSDPITKVECANPSCGGWVVSNLLQAPASLAVGFTRVIT
jgi:hypothetical protein